MKSRSHKPQRHRKLAGMRLVRGRAFAMGSNEFYPEESPVRDAKVEDFWIDEAPVTNRHFAAFVMATGYITQAERTLSAADHPALTAEGRQPGSSVFGVLDGIRYNEEVPIWWGFVPGASWTRPLGPGSSIERLGDHPVVHVAAEDAEAYATWAGKSLPSEPEWEFACRGGLDGKPYAWGDVFEPNCVPRAKYWQGTFPDVNLAPPGLERTAPVGSYPPNGYGLHDMIGNVWEWTADSYVEEAPSTAPCCHSGGARANAVAEPDRSSHPTPRRVTKGGSHLCSPDYCRRYRPAARWAQPIDSPTSHIGFRCVVRR